MKYSNTSVGGGVEILASKDFQSIPQKLATPGSGTVVKAGTPINASGESTTGSGAIGVLLYDVDTAENPTARWLCRASSIPPLRRNTAAWSTCPHCTKRCLPSCSVPTSVRPKARPVPDQVAADENTHCGSDV